MKKKNLLISASLALGVGVGVFAGIGLHNGVAEVDEVRALKPFDETYTIYVNLTWTSDEFKTGRYSMYWFNDSISQNGWVDMPVTSVANLYKAVIPATADSVIVCAMNSETSTNSWSDKQYQTADISLSSFDEDSKNTLGVNDSKNGEGKYNFWIDATEYQPELTVGDVYLRGSWANGWADISKKMTYVSENVYTIEDVLLSKDDELKAISISADHTVAWYSASDVVSESKCASFVSPNVVVNTTGSYDVTVNLSTKVYTVEVAVDEDLDAAVDFANDFKTQMALYCPILGTDPSKGTAALSTQWSNFKTRYLNDAQTSSTARTYLATLDNSTLNEFRERYDSILKDYYALLSGYDFLDRASELGLAKGVSSGLGNNADNKVLVITVTAASIALLGTAGFFLLRRRKEN